MVAPRALLLFAATLLCPTIPVQADRIVLRDLDVISDRTVEHFDEDGVQLDNGTVIRWDNIERGRIAESEQSEFDKMLADLGSHLYRIRQRLLTSDYVGLLPHAEAIYDRYAGRRSETAYMVLQALMWSRLAVGQREAALSAYLECVECLRQAAADKRELPLPGARRLQADLQTGLSPELPPVWFDAEAARQSLAGVAQTISAMAKPRPPATRAYFATLALAAGETRHATQALSGLNQLPALRSIVEAQLKLDRGEVADVIDTLEGQIDQFPDSLKPLALYWLGQARITDSDMQTRSTGLLDLLRIPALFGSQQPELAAAGLYTTMHSLAESEDVKGSISIRRELLDRYGQTWHAKQLRSEDKKTQRQP